LIEHLQDLFNWQGSIKLTNEQKEKVNYRQHIILNTDKIRSLLHYQEQYSLEEGLEEAVAYEKSLP
jgi:nucleoside-diphosphate-sugar epimerase